MAQAPIRITQKTGSGLLCLHYDDGEFELSYEFLRVHSPSAEVRGHGQGNEILQHGKKFVVLERIEPVGNYGLKLVFNDGHDSGIYTWETLRSYAINRDAMWESYLKKLSNAGQTREPKR